MWRVYECSKLYNEMLESTGNPNRFMKLLTLNS